MQSWKWLVMALVCVLGVSMAASAGNSMGVADLQKITFTGTVRIGDSVLAKGDYEVRHVMEGENHIMVFHALGNSKAPDVRVKCSLQPLAQKADQTKKIYTVNAANEQVLQAIIFRGDTAKHVFQ